MYRVKQRFFFKIVHILNDTYVDSSQHLIVNNSSVSNKINVSNMYNEGENYQTGHANPKAET